MRTRGVRYFGSSLRRRDAGVAEALSVRRFPPGIHRARRPFVADWRAGRIEALPPRKRPGSLKVFVKEMGRDNPGEVSVLANFALGPSGTTGVVLKVVRPFTGR